jgi:basic membrane protein A and related proteins
MPEVIRITNAFVLGARAVNPDVKFHVVWTNAWYDPATESEAANSLLDIGADVIATQSDSPAPVQTAERRRAYGVGYNSDASKFAPKKHLVSAIWNWGPYYVETVKQVRAGTWQSADEWWPIGTGIVGLSPLGPAVSNAIKNLVEQRTGSDGGTLRCLLGAHQRSVRADAHCYRRKAFGGSLVEHGLVRRWHHCDRP